MKRDKLKPEDIDRIYTAIVATNTPKPSAEAKRELQTVLAKYPNAWREAGDLGKRARQVLMQSIIADMAENVRASIESGLERQAEELRQPSDGPLEELLIDQILTCWLDENLTRAGYASVMAGSHSFAVGDYWQRKLTMTQQRYLRAIESLAKVRRLMRFTLQVNIAQPGSQVVNVAGDMQTGGTHATANL